MSDPGGSSKLVLAKQLGKALLIGAGVAIGLVSLLAVGQRSLIYMPRQYRTHASYYKGLKARLGVTK